jgi:TonB family protein
VYPKDVRNKGVEADVILRITISVNGDVADVEVLSGDEPFASAAVAAVKTWRYRPATVDGVAVPVKRKVKIPFRIQT